MIMNFIQRLSCLLLRLIFNRIFDLVLRDPLQDIEIEDEIIIFRDVALDAKALGALAL